MLEYSDNDNMQAQMPNWKSSSIVLKIEAADDASRMSLFRTITQSPKDTIVSGACPRGAGNPAGNQNTGKSIKCYFTGKR